MADQEDPLAKTGSLDDSFLPIERRILSLTVGGQRGFLVLRLMLAATLGFQAVWIAGVPRWLVVLPAAYAAAAGLLYRLRTVKKLSDRLGPWTFLLDVGTSLAVLHFSEGTGLDAYMALLLLILGANLLQKPILIFSVSLGAVLCYSLVMFSSSDEFLRDFPMRLCLFLLVSLFSIHIVDYAGMVERQTARRYEERLAWMQRLSLVGRAMAAVLHEAKTPLGSIVLNAETAAASLDKGKKPVSELRIIAEEADHATAILQNFLDFVKPTRLDLQPLMVHEPLLQALDMLKIRLDEQGVSLELTTRTDCPIRGSARHLAQAFTNILNNAVDAMPSGGKLAVWMEKRQKAVSIHFKDSGQGMRPEVLDTLFEPFTTSKPGEEGHGLGLSIVRWIAQTHDGDISIRSAGPGKGAHVEIRLPLEEKS